MNRRGKSKGVSWLLAGALLFAGACAGEVVPDDPAADDALPPANVAFESAFSGSGRFQVIEGQGGMLQLAIIARTGEDDPATLARAIHPDSLVSTYRGLHPGSEVPQRLHELETRYVEQAATARAATRQASPPAEVFAQVKVVAAASPSDEQADFQHRFCISYVYTDYADVVETCQYTTDQGGRLPLDPPPVPPLRQLCASQWSDNNQFWAKNYTNRGATLYQDGGENGWVSIPVGGYGFLGSFHYNSGVPVCVMTRGTGGFGLSRHLIVDIPQ
jgi:hypothetical protein